MKITYTAISEVGKRGNNEDAWRVVDLPEKNRWMGVVCDGLGGHAMGEVASETVSDVIADYWEKQSDTPDCKEKVVDACCNASKELDKRASQLNHCQMGTTMVMASIEDRVATIAHIGDSRCYLIRKGYYDYDEILNDESENVVYQTADHVRLDFGWEVVERCFFSYESAIAEPEVVQLEIQADDRILICSDGFYKSMAPNILKARVMDNKSPDEILDVLAFLCEKYGDDNYTAILAIIND